MQTAYISHHDCLLHEMGPYHPESPARLRAVEDQLIASGLFPLLQHHDAPLASREQLERVHAAGYVNEIFARSPAHGMVYLDPDTAMNPHTLQAALRAAGSAVLAVDLGMAGKAKNAFCNVRPPGHHAESARAMGFCIFNNVAVGVAHALEEHGLTRVAIADFDVHHGNGTEEIFRNDPRVMLCSTFQHPFYPHCGADTVSDHIINVPLPAGTDGAGFREAVIRRWLPELERFEPEMVFFSAGFDAHRDDEMAGLRLVEADYQWVTEQVKAIAEKYA
ncbi:MAG: histone deacetylase family protein, partial [Pseudomonadota bacterium]